MIKQMIRTASIGGTVLAVVFGGTSSAHADDASAAPTYAVGSFATASTRTPPCSTRNASCSFTLVASGTTVGLPSGTVSHCKDPGHAVVTTLALDCFLEVTGTAVPTRMICQANENIFVSLDVTYRSSTGREFVFIAVASMVNGDVVFDGSALNTTAGAELVWITGVMTNMCYTPSESQPAAYPPWGMKGTIRFSHVET